MDDSVIEEYRRAASSLCLIAEDVSARLRAAEERSAKEGANGLELLLMRRGLDEGNQIARLKNVSDGYIPVPGETCREDGSDASLQAAQIVAEAAAWIAESEDALAAALIALPAEKEGKRP